MASAGKNDLPGMLEEIARRQKTRRIDTYFLTSGRYRRELYPRHMQFFALGATCRNRVMLAANRVGKTEAGLIELVYHLTGQYPAWWEGRRFYEPIVGTVAGDTSKTVRDILQRKLFGPEDEIGTGLIPRECLITTRNKSGVSGAYDYVTIKWRGQNEYGRLEHGSSVLNLRSYDQGRKAFQGDAQHVIMLDEEPTMDIYTECLTRTMTVQGMVYQTFTPLQGLTPLVLHFLPDGRVGDDRSVVMATWDDVPHLSAEDKAELLKMFPAHERDARTKGVPMLGSGAVFQLPESEFVCDDFEIPPHFPRAFGLDVGWNCTAVVWQAWDREKDITYVWRVYKGSELTPSQHVKEIGREWPGVSDPAARGRSQLDGHTLFDAYRELGLDIGVAINAREAGLYEMDQRMRTGRYKIFKSCRPLLDEIRIYRRDKNGIIVKASDHAIDASRYCTLSGPEVAKPMRVVKSAEDEITTNTTWMA